MGKHAFTTGQIALRGFEKVLSPSTMKIGIEDGIGCYPDKLPEDEQTRRISPISSGMNSPPPTISKDAAWSFSPPAATAA